MAYNYSKADDQALASAWFPEATRPFKYEVRKTHYDYDLKQMCYEVFKSIEGSYSIALSHEFKASQGTAEGLLEMARLSGDVEKYFDERTKASRIEWQAKHKAEQL